MRINPRADSLSSVFVHARSYYDRKYRVCQLRSRSGGGRRSARVFFGRCRQGRAPPRQAGWKGVARLSWGHLNYFSWVSKKRWTWFCIAAVPLFVLTRATSFLCRRCWQLQLRTGPPHEASSNENDTQPAHQLRSARRHGCLCKFLSRTKVEARRKLMTFFVLSLRTLSYSGRPGRPTSSSLASTYVLLLASLPVSYALTGSPVLSADRRVHRLLATGDARDG
jgi:hypothetical protein